MEPYGHYNTLYLGGPTTFNEDVKAANVAGKFSRGLGLTNGARNDRAFE